MRCHHGIKTANPCHAPATQHATPASYQQHILGELQPEREITQAELDESFGGWCEEHARVGPPGFLVPFADDDPKNDPTVGGRLPPVVGRDHPGVE